MSDFPDYYTNDQTACALQLLYVRSICLNFMTMAGDGRHWFAAMAEDIRTVLIEADVPAAMMDAQDAKHRSDCDG